MSSSIVSYPMSRIASKVSVTIDLNSLSAVTRNRVKRGCATGIMQSRGKADNLVRILRNSASLPTLVVRNSVVSWDNMPPDHTAFWQALENAANIMRIQGGYNEHTSMRLDSTIRYKRARGWDYIPKELRPVFLELEFPAMPVPDSPFEIVLVKDGELLGTF